MEIVGNTFEFKALYFAAGAALACPLLPQVIMLWEESTGRFDR
jgi:hypothetical protein